MYIYLGLLRYKMHISHYPESYETILHLEVLATLVSCCAAFNGTKLCPRRFNCWATYRAFQCGKPSINDVRIAPTQKCLVSYAAWAAITKYHRLSTKNRNLFLISNSSGGWKVQYQDACRFLVGKSVLPGL